MSAGPLRADAAIVADELRGSRRYTHLCDRTLRRTARWAAGRSPTVRDAVKKAKRKLHQVYGAYVTAWKPDLPDTWALQGGGKVPNAAEAKEHCLRAMALHASTRERAPFLDRFYREVFTVTGVPATVLDLGCGLHPLGLPWMGLAPGSRYDALDMDGRVVAAIRGFFARTGQTGTVFCTDLLDFDAGRVGWGEGRQHEQQVGREGEMHQEPQVRPEQQAGQAWRDHRVQYDLAFLLKTVPCLEHQEKGASERLLRATPAHAFVISFACTSLGGGRRQVPRQYDAMAERLLGVMGRTATRLMIGNELVFAAFAGPEQPRL